MEQGTNEGESVRMGLGRRAEHNTARTGYFGEQIPSKMKKIDCLLMLESQGTVRSVPALS